MATDSSQLARQLAQAVVRGLRAGHAVEIDGLGVFHPDAELGCRFEAGTAPRVFLAYAREDAQLVEKLYDDLTLAGFSPWMDTRKLVPGQNWPRAIESAIENADFFIACFSTSSVNKKGGFQAEIRYALDCARRMPLDQIFIIPVRLNACPVPRAIQRELQYVDLFCDRDSGLQVLASTITREWERRLTPA